LRPIDKIDWYWKLILETVPRLEDDRLNKNLELFLDYFTSTYFEGSFTMNLWNHYHTHNTPRTNNNIEGYNNKLKKYVDATSPNIYKAINVFKKEEVTA
jgi:hypothetical protein